MIIDEYGVNEKAQVFTCSSSWAELGRLLPRLDGSSASSELLPWKSACCPTPETGPVNSEKRMPPREKTTNKCKAVSHDGWMTYDWVSTGG